MTVKTLENVVKRLNEQILSMPKSTLPDANGLRRFGGRVDGLPIESSQFRRYLPAYGVPQSKDGKGFPLQLPVVARIDEKSSTSGFDLPVVVAVGISPGEATEQNRAIAALGLYSCTNIRPRLEAALAAGMLGLIGADAHNRIPEPDKYHLVVLCLFPWLTEKAWAELNLTALGESLLLYGIGYDDPLLALQTLLRLLEQTAENNSPVWVVFHGSSALIPSSAIRFAHHRTPTGPDVLICDDLNGAAPIQNSVVLGRPYLTRADTVGMNVDE